MRRHTVAAAKLARNGRKLKCVVTQYLDSHSKQEAMPRLRRKVRVGGLLCMLQPFLFLLNIVKGKVVVVARINYIMLYVTNTNTNM